MIKPNWDISNYTKHSISEIQNFGVYAIMGKLNDDVLYIGSTKATSNLKTGHHKIGFAKRWGKHIDIFRHGGRSNLNLLAYINNDPSKIYFIILEVVDYNIKEDILLQKEIKDKLNKKRSVKKYRPLLESFSGYSECFDYLGLNEILDVFDTLTKNA